MIDMVIALNYESDGEDDFEWLLPEHVHSSSSSSSSSSSCEIVQLLVEQIEQVEQVVEQAEQAVVPLPVAPVVQTVPVAVPMIVVEPVQVPLAPAVAKPVEADRASTRVRKSYNTHHVPETVYDRWA